MEEVGPKNWAWMSSIRIAVLLVLWMVSSSTAKATMEDDLPRPNPWPHQFHSVLWVNYSGSLSLIDLWYDWPNGRNFNIIRDQLSPADATFYDLEWNNGTSFQYTLPPAAASYSCRSFQLDVGILRPDWLVDGSIYLGQRHVDGFLCNVWQKADFIWYYEDVLTKAPVHWVFYTGRSIHVMTFEVGAVLEDSKWQAPVYCFDDEHRHNQTETRSADISDMPGNRWMTQ